MVEAKPQWVTIVPPERKADGPALVQGTRVLLEDGTQLRGVTKLVLTAEANDIWRAEIHCHVMAVEMPGVLASVRIGPLPWWRRLLCRLAGVKVHG